MRRNITPFEPSISKPDEDGRFYGGFNAHQEISIRFMAAMLSNPNFTERMRFTEIAFESIDAADKFVETYNQ